MNTIMEECDGEEQLKNADLLSESSSKLDFLGTCTIAFIY